MEQKAFFIRLAKEFDIYDLITNDEYDYFKTFKKYDYLKTYIKSPYINNIIDEFLKCIKFKNKIKYDNELVKVNYSLLYDILPFSPQRIIIRNIENRKKMLKYLDENGVIWSSFNRLDDKTTFNDEGIVNFCITDGLLSWGRTEFWKDSHYKDIIFSEDEFYVYWNNLMLKIKNNFNKIIKINLYDNNNNIRKS